MATLSWDDLVSGADQADAPIPEGDYTLVVDEAEYRLSKKNDPQFVLKLKVADEGPWQNRMVYHYATATADSDGGKRAFVKTVRALLGRGARLDFSATPEELAGPFFGKTAKAKLKHETYQGETRAKVAYFIENKADVPPPAAAPASAHEDDVPPPMPVA